MVSEVEVVSELGLFLAVEVASMAVVGTGVEGACGMISCN